MEHPRAALTRRTLLKGAAIAPLPLAAAGTLAGAAWAGPNDAVAVAVDLTRTVSTTTPEAVGICCSTYGLNPVTSPAQAAAEDRLDARFVRIPLGIRNGVVSSSAAGSNSGDAVALVDWYRARGIKVIAVLGGRTNDVDIAVGDAGRIVRALGTELIEYSSPNEPNLRGWGVGQAIDAGRAIWAEGAAVDPGFRLWGPVWTHLDNAALLAFAEGMGPNRLAGIDYHHYAMGESSLLTTSSFAQTPDYGREVFWLRSQLRKRGLPDAVNIDELNYSWRYEDGTGPTGKNDRFYTAVNTVWIACVLGHVVANGGHGMVYSTQNGPLGLTTEPGNGDQGLAPATPMPAYWGVAAWTGAGIFPHFATQVRSARSDSSMVPAWALDNEAGGHNILVVNKSEVDTKTVTVKLTGAPATYDVVASNPSLPFAPLRKVAANARHAGSVRVTLPPLGLAVVVLKA